MVSATLRNKREAYHVPKAHTLGREIEEEHMRKHQDKELSEEEARNVLLSTGLLADGAKEYAERFGKRWLVTNYEAGDVVFHTPYTVGTVELLRWIILICCKIHASTVNYDPNNAIRVGTDLRYVDKTRPYDKV